MNTYEIMNTSKTELPYPWQSVVLSTTSSTWFDRLFLNLLSYSLVLGPIASIVFVTRLKLCPTSWQTSPLIKWFVYGNNNLNLKSSSDIRDSKKLLIVEDTNSKRRSSVENNTEFKSKNTTLVLIWCFLGLQLSYLCWGILQEKIMTTKYQVTSDSTLKQIIPPNNSTDLRTTHNTSSYVSNDITFHDSQFLVFLNRVIAFILSIIALVYNRPKQSQLLSGAIYVQNRNVQTEKPTAPLYEYVYCSLSNILSSWCQLEALKYVNFPTQVLSKSCKIVPVMLMSKVMLKKKYQSVDYLCAIILSLGMFIFLVNQPKSVKHGAGSATNISSSLQQNTPDEMVKQSNDNLFLSGLIILALYLAFDSFTSNWQQSIFSRYEVSNWQMMAATNFYSIILTLTSLYQLGHLAPAFKLILTSSHLMMDCLLMSIMSSVGQFFVYFTIKRFGSVVFAVIMTLRQFLAILLSCAIYGHQLTLGSGIGLLVVFFVVAFQMRRKSSNRSRTTIGKTQLVDTVRIQFKSTGK